MKMPGVLKDAQSGFYFRGHPGLFESALITAEVPGVLGGCFWILILKWDSTQGSLR